MRLLGISSYYHDAAACLTDQGRIVAALQEERFTRRKFDERFPAQAIAECLRIGRIGPDQIDALVFYDKPWLTFERLLETYLTYAPRGLNSFLRAMPIWLNGKLNLRGTLKREFRAHFKTVPRILFSEHHLSHAASAFYPSPFEEAAVLCLDGVGEWATTTAWLGRGDKLDPLWQIRFPHSLGLLYSAFTAFCGFKVNSGEYKLMGAAPYGKPIYQSLIERELIDIKEDGSFRLNMKYFDFAAGLRMYNRKFEALFGFPPRVPETRLREVDFDLAASVQATTEKAMLRLARALRERTGMKNLCLAGGVALNCVANGKIAREGIFDSIWVQPAAGDAGGALGAALAAHHLHFREPRQVQKTDGMHGALLGDHFEDTDIESVLRASGVKYRQYADPRDLLDACSELLAQNNVLGWFQNRMEYGPRALGSRSILADPRGAKMRAQLNLKIKFRETFRPFAPIVMREHVNEYFEFQNESPYMLVVANVRESRPQDIPAVTHVDGSARLQTVDPSRHPRLHALLESFRARTGCPVLINTSFNVRGEPIVHTPAEALNGFRNTEMDALCIGSFLITKADNPGFANPEWRKSFELD